MGDGQPVVDEEDVMDGIEENAIIVIDDAEENLNESGDAEDIPKENQPIYPVHYYHNGTFEELPEFPLDLLRPSIVEEENWRDVQCTWSTFESATYMLRECHSPSGITFIILRRDQHL